MKKVKKRKNYENTFRLAPDEKPKIGEIRNDLQKSLDASCMDVEYQMIEARVTFEDNHIAGLQLLFVTTVKAS